MIAPLKRKRPLPAVFILQYRLEYNPTTGILRWSNPTGPIHIGAEAGCINSDGYKVFVIEGTQVYAHRAIWAIVTGEWPKCMIDHEDGNTINNKWDNLREANDSQNSMNCVIRSDNTSGVTGVSWHTDSNKWTARINANNRFIHLGRFSNFDDAVAARLAAEKQYFGEFQRK